MHPLRGYKGNYYEGGIRVPFFVHWPGVVAPGGSSVEPVIGVDVYPTLLDITGADRPDQPLDGVSLLPVLRGEVVSLPERPLFWHFPAYLESYRTSVGEQPDPLFRTRPCSVVRLGDFKLHQYFEDGRLELYDLRHDVGEQSNLVTARPGKTRELLDVLEAWREEVGAPVPTERNPEYDQEAEVQAIRASTTPEL